VINKHKEHQLLIYLNINPCFGQLFQEG